ncbi:hypothetical protein DVH05_017034 [Phytophthora capsici]|nr:hypothetical protein DVH05_017034 [Phytophthora capsici]
MAADWSFLEPWSTALRQVLSLQESLSSRALARLSCCRHGGNPRSLVVCMLVVNFPADEERRKDRVFLQTVREAIELFNVLAEVDKAAVVGLLPGNTDIIRELWDLSDTSRGIQLIWDCTLVGQLSPNDLVASKPSVTWGELFGCPDDPWEYAEDFREAMYRLESIGQENNGDVYSVLESIEYCAKFDGVPVTGDQSVANTSDIFSLIEPLSLHICVLFKTDHA